MNRIANAKSGLHSLTEPFSGHSSGKTASDMLEAKVSQYDIPVMVILVGGIVLVIVGGSVVGFGKRKKRR
jgi:hypothetical protein